MATERCETLPGWEFTVEEGSAGVYKAGLSDGRRSFYFRAEAEGPILLAGRVGTVAGFIPTAPILVFPGGVKAVDGIVTAVSPWHGCGRPRRHLRVFNVG